MRAAATNTQVLHAGHGLVMALLLLILSACSSLTVDSTTDPSDTEETRCRRWFSLLDQQIAQHGVGDAQDQRIAGFPQLRVSRFAASFRDQAAQDRADFGDWLDLLQVLGAEAHAIEIANLPEAVVDVLPGNEPASDNRERAMARTQHCAQVLSDLDRAAPDRRAMLLDRAVVPDAYSTAARVWGMYALTRLPFAAGVRRWQADTVAAFNVAGPSEGVPITRYVPLEPGDGYRTEAFTRVPRDALGIPQLDEALRQQLLDRHAPVFALPVEGGFDRIGALKLAGDGTPDVDTTQPTVYRRIAFVRQGQKTLVQLVYLAWFPERPPAGSVDLLAGTLDGLVWRVTLDDQGRPLLYDSIHACGCYHLFFPTRSLRAKPAPEPGIEWLFTPANPPELARGERMLLHLAPRTHYLTGLAATREPQGERYRSLPEGLLRSLPLPGGGHRSLYGPDGIIAGTQRGERYLFWPMGVRDAGAQRQWGHHATAFVGRRHFDDPHLVDQRFDVVEPSGAGAESH